MINLLRPDQHLIGRVSFASKLIQHLKVLRIPKLFAQYLIICLYEVPSLSRSRIVRIYMARSFWSFFILLFFLFFLSFFFFFFFFLEYRIYMGRSFRSYGGEYKLGNEAASCASDRNTFNSLVISSVRQELFFCYDVLLRWKKVPNSRFHQPTFFKPYLGQS